MTITDLLNEIPMKVLCGNENLDREISRGVSSDMMSNVIAKGTDGDLWITFQTHMNVIAIAQMKKMAGIILVQDRQLIPKAFEKAESIGMPVLVSSLNAFELGGRLYELGIHGD